jgi:hypothetical protein
MLSATSKNILGQTTPLCNTQCILSIGDEHLTFRNASDRRRGSIYDKRCGKVLIVDGRIYWGHTTRTKVDEGLLLNSALKTVKI